MKLALGTVQFGLDYGITNTRGKVASKIIDQILDFAFSHNISKLDTARAYGDAEKTLGQFDLSRFKIITKLFDTDLLENSLENLHVDQIYAAMFHRENQVNDKTWAYFESLKSQNLVEKIGVSAYSPKILSDLIEQYPVDIVQIPMNMLDLRFLPLLSRLKQKGIEIHCRSVFLQGLLLCDTNRIDGWFSDIIPVIDRIPAPRIRSALHCLKEIPEIDNIVVGVTCLNDLKEICAEYLTEKKTTIDLKSFAINDEKYVNPVNWKLSDRK